MNALAQSVEPMPQVAAVPLLRTLVLCDLVDSTALVERMGDQRATGLFRKHDRLARALVQQHGGREIDKTDGFLMMLDRPIQAVAFALDYQRALKVLNDNEKTSLASRIGIHVGDVLTWDNAPDDIAKGAKQIEVEGLVKPITSRLMQLALPNQILLSGVAHALAHRAQGELGEQLATVRWRTHGRYRFKGIPDPIPVFEVGEEGHAPLKAPPWSGKAHREIPFWRRPATMGIEIGLLVLLLAIPAWYLFKPAHAIAFANRDWVVVGDLKNLTGEASFDEAIDTAFRIGLEQSRYVNVLSNLKTRETVKLMQQDPDTIKVDRAVGSEIAIRDGARALILPTIAEIGGRVRVTAEVVDPNTQTTVYSESADGIGSGSVLPSLDKINQKLRIRLGEALATVSNESKPLDKVATKNLDALRAYSLAAQAYDAVRWSDAISLYRQAILLDTNFASAHIALARLFASSNQKSEALAELDAAERASDRLAARDTLYMTALRMSLAGSKRSAIEKWKLLATTYPDYFPAQGAYAYFERKFANNYGDDVIAHASSGASPRNPHAVVSQHLLGALNLGRERYDDAIKAFASAEADGNSGTSEYATAFAAKRQFEDAEATLTRGKRFGVASTDIEEYIPRIAMAADRSNWEKAWQTIDVARKNAHSDASKYVQLFDGIELSLRSLVSSNDSNIARLRSYVSTTREGLAATPATDRADVRSELLFAAYLAARAGEKSLAAEALASGRDLHEGDDPISQQMSAIVAAEQSRAAGKPQESLRILKPIRNGSELYLVHMALMDAYADVGDIHSALGEAQWLQTHRGLAYAENWAAYIAPFNVALSDLAFLREAEFLKASNDNAGAHRLLESFRKAWPNAEQIELFATRIKNLQTAL